MIIVGRNYVATRKELVSAVKNGGEIVIGEDQTGTGRCYLCRYLGAPATMSITRKINGSTERFPVHKTCYFDLIQTRR